MTDPPQQSPDGPPSGDPAEGADPSIAAFIRMHGPRRPPVPPAVPEPDPADSLAVLAYWSLEVAGPMLWWLSPWAKALGAVLPSGFPHDWASSGRDHVRAALRQVIGELAGRAGEGTADLHREAVELECLFETALLYDEGLRLRQRLDRVRAGVAGLRAVAERSDARPSPPKPPIHPELLALAGELGLKGDERALVEAVAVTGRVPLSGFAEAHGWDAAYSNSWEGLQGRLNRKLKRHGWRMSREDSHAIAVPLPPVS